MNVFNATVFALEYGIPLLSFAKLAQPLVHAGLINYLIPSATLATPQSTIVVQPNIDTLYSTAVYDLSQGDIKVTIPEVDTGRYWSFNFYDPYGDDFASPGSVLNSPSGVYLLRYSSDGNWGLEIGDNSDGYQGYINSPTIDGVLLVRILVKNNHADLAYVRNLIEAAALTPILRNYFATRSLTAANLAPYSPTADMGLATLELLGNFYSANPPFNISAQDHELVSNTMFTAGIYNGSYHHTPGVNLTLAYDSVLSQQEVSKSSVFQSYGNGWYHNTPQGLYGSDYLGRAVAVSLYLEQGPQQALYPVRIDGSLQLAVDESYLYTFSKKPPIGSGGFWSMTLYNSEGFLVANPINKYGVGDRSDITYPDGTMVYDSSSTTVDGEFQVLVQAGNSAPPDNWTNNWLPAPSDGSTFSVTLRLYAPTSALLDASYEYPILSKGQTILD